MIEAKSCVICDGAIRRRKRALVAPFLALRIWNRKAFTVDLVKCADCGFLFYNPRLDDEETQKLYSAYRSAEYLQMRNASEHWYTPEYNAELASPASYERRRAIVGRILRELGVTDSIKRVLDFGGDRGDLVAGLVPGAEAFVFDISGITPVEGVSPVADPSECRADLVVNSNVLEHVGFPRGMVEEMLRILPEKGLLFLEVPVESPFSASALFHSFARIPATALRRPAAAWQIARPSSLWMMHEHINYYTEATLVRLAQEAGGTVVGSGTYNTAGHAGRADMAWCLARR